MCLELHIIIIKIDLDHHSDHEFLCFQKKNSVCLHLDDVSAFGPLRKSINVRLSPPTAYTIRPRELKFWLSEYFRPT
jgi:hypothetical protein